MYKLSQEQFETIANALRSASGAMDSADTQIGQMSGMFDDRDGAIADALQDLTDAGEKVEEATGLLDDLQAMADQAASHDALSKPVEIAIHVDGGIVQAVSKSDERPVTVYIHDHDIGDADPDSPTLGNIVFNNSPDETSSASLSAEEADHVPGASAYWTSLRDEIARLEGPLDARYSIQLENCGHETPRHVVRFCDEWVGQSETAHGADQIARAHEFKRQQELAR